MIKPFNLKKALAGTPVELRCGYKAYVTKHDENPTFEGMELIGYYIEENGDDEEVWDCEWFIDGKFYTRRMPDDLDIIGMWEI